MYDYDVAGRRLVLLKQTPVLGGYDPTRYRSERLHATASDGTRIPVSLVSRVDSPRDAPAPMLLTGYGAYGFAYPVTFSSARLSLLDRGVTFAIAHVRGGGEMGKRWHDEGRMLNKPNTFTDFIATADFLVQTGRTAPERLVTRVCDWFRARGVRQVEPYQMVSEDVTFRLPVELRRELALAAARPD